MARRISSTLVKPRAEEVTFKVFNSALPPHLNFEYDLLNPSDASAVKIRPWLHKRNGIVIELTSNIANTKLDLSTCSIA